MPRRVAVDPTEQQLIADIEEFGWHCVHIREEGDQPPYSFTVGLYESWQHPELIIVGLPSDTSHKILNIMAEAIRHKRPIDLNAPTDALIAGLPCCFIEVAKDNYFETVGFARWYYDGNNFPLYQIVWPSKDGYYPWSPQVSDHFKSWQMILGNLAATH